MEFVVSVIPRSRTVARLALIPAFLLAALAVPALAGEPQPGPAGAARLERPPTAKQSRYSLAGRIRPLLFWIGKDNVGEARIGWFGTENGQRGYDLLVGSDPRKAPRGINRWGYISETEADGGLRVVGLMTEADAESLDQAKSTVNTPGVGTRVFKAIQSTVSPSESRAKVFGLTLSDRLSLHDLDTVLAEVPALPATAPLMAVPSGTSPGFLFAMASLIHESVDGFERTGTPTTGGRRSYIYGNKMYDVTVESSAVVKRLQLRGREYHNVIDTWFRTRKRTSGSTSLYRVVYGTDGDLREVPVRIVYRPKWWFEAEMTLVELK